MSAFAIDPVSGALTFESYSPNLGDPGMSVTADGLGQFVYSVNASGDVAAVSFDTNTGAFSSLINSPNVCFAAGQESLTLDLSGGFMYVADISDTGSGSVTVCSLDRATGDPNNVPCENSVAAGTYPESVVVTGTIH